MRVSRRRALIATCLALGLPVTAQDWRLVDGLSQPAAAAAYDAWRSRVVTVGDRAETREWNGTNWLHRPIAPLPALPIAMAFDDRRGVTVAVLAIAPAPALRTFEYDGSTWTERSSANAPSIRLGACLAFDALRRRTVLFGGGLLAPDDQTWEWDGTSWLLRSPTTRPSARSGSAMAFDSVRGRCVLFGGRDPTAGPFGTYFNDTWEWDGSNWTPRAPVTAPGPRADHGLAYDVARQVTVLFGSGFAGPPETWEYDGATWTQRTGPMPPQRAHGALVFDPARGRCVLFGGKLLTPHRDVWELDAAGWTPRPTPDAPAPRLGTAMAHAATRDRTVLFGGYAGGAVNADTWEWDGRGWARRQPATSPPPRSKHAMWTDGTDVFVFGGLDASLALVADTWRFDGTSWSAIVSPVQPAARQFHAVAFDPVNGGALLFGGSDSSSALLGDTWRLSPAGWTQVLGTPGPSPRAGAAIATDLLRRRVVLWGGVGSGSTLLDDTWEWDGTAWQPRSPAHRPVATGVHTMAWEPGLGVTVLLARASQFDARLVVWLWNGVDWSPLATPTTIASQSWMNAVATNGEVRLHDGDHLLALTDLPPRVVRYGMACAAPPPRLDADEWPRPGAAGFALSFAAHTPDTPIAALLATSSANTPVAGCTLLVQPGGPTALLLADGHGSAALPLPLPPSATLIGFVCFAQAWSLCPAGLCSTAGLQIALGR